MSARYAQRELLLCSVKSSFTTPVNKRALHNIYAPYVLHRNALESKVIPEYLKIVLKHVTERVDFKRAHSRLFKVLYKNELIYLLCGRMLYSSLICYYCNFSKFWCGLGE